MTAFEDLSQGMECDTLSSCQIQNTSAPVLLPGLGDVAGDDLDLLQHGVIRHLGHHLPLLGAGAQHEPALIAHLDQSEVNI